MPKSLCRLLICVNYALVAIFSVTNMSFNAIRENKILAKIYGFTVSHQVGNLFLWQHVSIAIKEDF